MVVLLWAIVEKSWTARRSDDGSVRVDRVSITQIGDIWVPDVLIATAKKELTDPSKFSKTCPNFGIYPFSGFSGVLSSVRITVPFRLIHPTCDFFTFSKNLRKPEKSKKIYFRRQKRMGVMRDGRINRNVWQ